jgi:hypothetical protein
MTVLLKDEAFIPQEWQVGSKIKVENHPKRIDGRNRWIKNA